MLKTQTVTRFFAAEHGGDGVKGGGHPSDKFLPAEEAIADGQDQGFPGRGKVPGTGDPGVPGSRTNPADPNQEPEREEEGSPAGRLTEGSGSGS
jgi:hypothetical protein